MSKAQENVETLRGLSVESDPGEIGFWIDDTPATKIHRMRDRVFFGDAALNNGRRTTPYGTSPISTYVGTWPEKNAQVIVGSTNGRIGFLGWTNLSDDDTSGTSIAIAGFARAKKASGTSRGFYSDATIESGAGSIFGYEFAGTNRAADVTGNSYTLSGSEGVVYGAHLIMEGGTGYTLGDSDTPTTVGAYPGTAAINIGSGTGGTAVKRWNMGIRFQSNSLTGTDGVTGTAQALQLAKGHEINWMASSTIQGAKIRSDVTAVSGHDVSLIFEPDVVSFYGTTSKRTFATEHVSSGVNNVMVKNAATGFFPIIAAEGTDTNIGVFFDGKGQASFRFRTNGGTNEDFRIGGVQSAPVNYLHAYGSNTGIGATYLEAKGTDTNINLVLTPKGSGNVMFGTHSALAAETVSGYITIKDAAGNSRKLAVVS